MKRLVLLAAFAIVGLAQSATITVGQTENFESGGLGGFSNGVAPDPVNQPTGGPLGAGDNFMLLSASGGFGPGSRLTVFNRTVWAGDYTAVSGLEMDLNNLGATTLNVRISLNNGNFNGAPAYVSTENVTLAPSSGWQRFSFTFANMIPLNGAPALATHLTNITELRIFHAPNPDTNVGAAIAGSLGVDNVTAIPEPTAAALALAALAVGCIRRKR